VIANRVSNTPGNLLQLLFPPGGPGNLLAIIPADLLDTVLLPVLPPGDCQRLCLNGYCDSMHLKCLYSDYYCSLVLLGRIAVIRST